EREVARGGEPGQDPVDVREPDEQREPVGRTAVQPEEGPEPGDEARERREQGGRRRERLAAGRVAALQRVAARPGDEREDGHDAHGGPGPPTGADDAAERVRRGDDRDRDERARREHPERDRGGGGRAGGAHRVPSTSRVQACSRDIDGSTSAACHPARRSAETVSRASARLWRATEPRGPSTATVTPPGRRSRRSASAVATTARSPSATPWWPCRSTVASRRSAGPSPERLTRKPVPETTGASDDGTRRTGCPAWSSETPTDAAHSTAHSPSASARWLDAASSGWGRSPRSRSTVTGGSPALSSARTMSWPWRAALAQCTRRGSSPAT